MEWNNFPSLTSLRAFAAAAEYRNLTKAAAALNVTHSAVSQQIRGLEQHLDTRLVTRTRHGISLTSQGEFLAAGLLEVFAKMESLTESVSSVEAVRPLVVSATPMFSSAFLMPRLSTFIEEHPHIELRIDSTIQAVDLRPGGIDLAIRYGTGKWSGLKAQMVLPGCLTVVASGDLIGKRVLKEPSELLDFTLLQEHASVEFDLWLEKAGVSPNANRRVVRMPGNMLLDGIRRGDGIGATVPAFIVDELRSGKLIALFDDPIPEIGYYMVTLPGAVRPAVKSFMRWLSKSITEYEQSLFRWQPAHLL